MSSKALSVDVIDSTLSPVGITMKEFVTVRVAGQMFGISVLAVQDVIRKQRITPVPLAPPMVAGALNLRGRIVTAIDMRTRLGLPATDTPATTMKVVVEYQHELYALMVDSVGDVLTLSLQQMEKTPANLDSAWRQVSAGVYKLDKELLVILDIAHIIEP